MLTIQEPFPLSLNESPKTIKRPYCCVARGELVGRASTSAKHSDMLMTVSSISKMCVEKSSGSKSGRRYIPPWSRGCVAKDQCQLTYQVDPKHWSFNELECLLILCDCKGGLLFLAGNSMVRVNQSRDTSSSSHRSQEQAPEAYSLPAISPMAYNDIASKVRSVSRHSLRQMPKCRR